MSHTVEGSRLPLSRGLTVETIDGRPLGIVAEVGEDFFLTRRARGGDVWFPAVFVRTVGATSAVLQLDARSLRRYVPGSPVRSLRSVAATGLVAAVAFAGVAAAFV